MIKSLSNKTAGSSLTDERSIKALENRLNMRIKEGVEKIGDVSKLSLLTIIDGSTLRHQSPGPQSSG